MQVGTQAEAPAHAASALVAHLRDHPEDALRPPEELAERFSLPPNFVRSVLEGLTPPEQRQAETTARGLDWRRGMDLVHRAAAAFDKLVRLPMRFLVLTLAVALAISIFAGTYLDQGQFRIARSGAQINADDLILLTAIIAFILHMACYFRVAMLRYVLKGSLILWASLSITMMVVVWQEAQGSAELSRFARTMFVAIAMFFLSSFYATLGGLATVLGGWYKIRKLERAEERMTRQDLLERYFDLRTRLERSAASAAPEQTWTDWSVVEFVRRHPLEISFFAGLALATINVLSAVYFGINPLRPGPGTATQNFYILLSTVIAAASFLWYVVIGFVARSLLVALGSTLLFQLASIIPTLLPIGFYGPHVFRDGRALLGTAIASAVFLGVTAIAYMGGAFQRRAAKQASLQRDDQAAIVAEMLRIQWKLSDPAKTVCVMVVDAAKSSEMKASADPLAVEYSFREYQAWLQRISGELHGRVHSTAGDGAVIAFDNCLDAYLAAKRIQTDLPRFNSQVNRLPAPFRLRVGLHVGEVAGALDEIQFTEVIDIAAHVQQVAPIAGIAVTEDVVAQLSEDEFVPLAREVDGKKVHLALNPTED